MKAATIVRWTTRLAIVAIAAWFLHPAYRKPPSTRPTRPQPDDSVTWTYRETPNSLVIQELTVYRDGRSKLLLTRILGDPDIPEQIIGWKLGRDKQNNLTRFERDNVITTDEARAMLVDAVEAGVLDVTSLSTSRHPRLTVRGVFGVTTNIASGPTDLGSAFDWIPARWVNRQRWQALTRLIENRPELRQQLEKRDIQLIDNHGNPVERP